MKVFKDKGLIILETNGDALRLKSIIQLAEAKLAEIEAKVDKDLLLYDRVHDDIEKNKEVLNSLKILTIFKTH